MQKLSLLNIRDTIQPIAGGFRVNEFPKGISLKVNMLARLEFEPVYVEDLVQHISHFTTGTSTMISSTPFYFE